MEVISLAAKIRAWNELMKVALNIGKLRGDIDNFFRGNIVRSLQDEGWFDYLTQPRTVDEIASQFQYTDTEFLQSILDVFTSDHTLSKGVDNRYVINGVVEDRWVLPTLFDGSMVELWKDYAVFLPDRLRGKYLEFTSGMSLFDWDNVLGLQMYEQVRLAAFQFGGAFNRTGRFLDIGSGNGRGTSAIWSYYFKRNRFFSGTDMRIYGVEPDEGLSEIAREEFSMMAAELLGVDVKEIDAQKDHHPEFHIGLAEKIPFEDEYFDMVYASQVIHWTSWELAIKEMLRVLKPGGIFFGAESFYPTADPYSEIHFKVTQGADGYHTKTDFERWAMEGGAKSVKFATPITVFKVTK
ncbi:MAG: class I SAM-dependent methyltransferase [Candidatus Thorarchaeota archaeon]|nr:class I SAM-dependent methyltransferase [Candidatus Thorarchaeota archaeon]